MDPEQMGFLRVMFTKQTWKGNSPKIKKILTKVKFTILFLAMIYSTQYMASKKLAMN
jgi:hypothetical protein